MNSPITAASASALALQIPSTGPVTTRPARPDALTAMPVSLTATFVGQRSAELVLVLTESDLVDDGTVSESLTLSAGDVLRPAFEAACGALGAGVLGEIRPDEPADLLADPLADAFELSSEGRTIGWFAIRMLDSPSEPGGKAGREDEAARRLARISNVAMTLTVEIGRARMPVRDALSIEPGTVVELDRSAGAPADILLNGRLIARGEVVVVDQDYAVRVTTIIDGAEGFI